MPDDGSRTTAPAGIHEHRCLHCGKTPSEAGVARCEALPLSYDDACRLSRLFNEAANLSRPQDYLINEWLKRLIVSVRDAAW